MRDWTVVTDVDGHVKIQDFDGTIATLSSRASAEAIINLIALLDEIAPHLLANLEVDLAAKLAIEIKPEGMAAKAES